MYTSLTGESIHIHLYRRHCFKSCKYLTICIILCKTTFISVILTALGLVRIAIQLDSTISHSNETRRARLPYLDNHRKTEHDLSDLLQFFEIVVLTSNYHLHELLRMKEILSTKTMPLTR